MVTPERNWALDRGCPQTTALLGHTGGVSKSLTLDCGTTKELLAACAPQLHCYRSLPALDHPILPSGGWNWHLGVLPKQLGVKASSVSGH